MRILSYAECVDDEYAIQSAPGEVPHVRPLSDAQRFFAVAGATTCVFCKRRLRCVLEEAAELSLGDEGYDRNAVHECSRCGWWRYEYLRRSEGATWRRDDRQRYVCWGIAKRFDVKSRNLPLRALREAVLKDPDLLCRISARKMEELVRYCFQSYFACEVEHCGRTGDGGVDLIVVMSDEPILVQIKRRLTTHRREQISEVREFLGAMFIQGSKSGIYVTNASRFTRGAIKVRDKLVEEESVRRFDLVDLERLVSMLGVARDNRFATAELPWHRMLRPLEYAVIPRFKDTYQLKVDRYRIRGR